MPTRQPSIAEAIDIPLWLEQDRDTPWLERTHRDRSIGREIPHRTGSPAERVLHWWRQVERPTPSPDRGVALERLFRRLGPVMIGAGALSGTGIAAAVLRYDGSDPINVLMVCGLLVLLPAAFLIASLLLPLWSGASLAGASSVGHIVLGVLKRHYPAFDEFFGTRHTNRARDRLLRWRLTLASQQFGLAFSVAALATLLAKASFSDLAFAWSTTLTVHMQHMIDTIGIIAAPWSAWLPEAVPDPMLIEQSRYFRLETAAGNLSAAALTPWWRFVAMTLITYGIVPRTIAGVAARWRLRAAERSLLLSHPEVRALLDRLDAPEIASGATTEEHAAQRTGAAAALFDGDADGDVVIIWNGAIAFSSAPAQATVIEAGGEHSPDTDRAALLQIPANVQGVVRVITKSWEPPLLELHDYLSALRQHIGDERSIVVQPIGESHAPPAPADVAVWRASLARLDDPGLYLQ